MLKFYNTLTRKKQPFTPLHDREVKMYTCGLTVYDFAHIGNMRSFLFEDLLRRVLEFNDLSVKHVQNFTDVGHLVSEGDEGEDKMELGAKREKKTAWQIADFYINAFKQDFRKLRMKEPAQWIRATDNIQEMIELVQSLQKGGYTYTTEDGVYFDTSKFKNYGKLARLNLKGLKAGARVSAEGKRNPTDFALWKFSRVKRDMEWDSPFGRGFPGWHIECSAMAMKYLGETIDIHCGGADHIPVHHTNEIAQSEAATGQPFAKFWLHNEHMMVDGKKMSKSLGNFYTVSQLEEMGFSPTAFRYLCLSVHYRSQMNFTFDALRDAQKTVDGINDFLHRLRHANAKGKNNAIEKALEAAEQAFAAAINDDLNTPEALAVLFDLMKTVNREMDSGKGSRDSLDSVHEFFVRINGIFDVIEERNTELTQEEKKLMELREHFRRQKDFSAADDIRAQLKEKGIDVEDTQHGARWKRI